LTTYRLDRRLVLPAIGLRVMLAGLAAALAFFLSSVGPLGWVLGVVAAVAVLDALRLSVLPPVALRTDQDGLRVGRQLTAGSIEIAWSEVQDVSVDAGRLLVDAGTKGTLPLPLGHVGPRAAELTRDVYDRLNTANGYRRFDPS